MDLQQLLEVYFDHKILRPDTKKGYRDAVISLLRARAYQREKLELSHITPKLLLRHRAQYIEKNRSPVTYNTKRRHLIALFHFAIEKRWLDKNPLKSVAPIPAAKRKPKTVQQGFLNEAYQVLFNGCADNMIWGRYDRVIGCGSPPGFWWTMLLVFHYTAMRRRQLVELVWEDINFDDKVIRLHPRGNKTRKELFLPMPDDLLHWLAELKRAIQGLGGRTKNHDQVFNLPVFSKRRERFKILRCNVDHISKFFDEYMSKRLDYRVSAHRLRHTTATNLIIRSKNLALVKEFLAHDSIASTMVYCHPDTESFRPLMNLIQVERPELTV